MTSQPYTPDPRDNLATRVAQAAYVGQAMMRSTDVFLEKSIGKALEKRGMSRVLEGSGDFWRVIEK